MPFNAASKQYSHSFYVLDCSHAFGQLRLEQSGTSVSHLEMVEMSRVVS